MGRSIFTDSDFILVFYTDAFRMKTLKLNSLCCCREKVKAKVLTISMKNLMFATKFNSKMLWTQYSTFKKILLSRIKKSETFIR